MTKKKKTKKEFKTKCVIDKRVARALDLAKCREKSRYAIGKIWFDRDKMSFCATDGRMMLLVKLKREAQLMQIDIDTGFYNVLGDTLIRADEQEGNFPKYEDIIPESNPSVTESEDILLGVLKCMIKNQVLLNLRISDKVLNCLNKVTSCWAFTSHGSDKPVLMEAETNAYKLKFVQMSIKLGVT